VRNGNIYVSEYGGNGKITLLRPNTTTVSSIALNDSTGNELDGSIAYLEQNAPNPFSNSTIIRYSVPQEAQSMKLLISDMNGVVLKTLPLVKGKGQVTISNEALPAGTYIYSLWIDGNQVDQKKMIVNR
jgi:hypothetical protein